MEAFRLEWLGRKQGRLGRYLSAACGLKKSAPVEKAKNGLLGVSMRFEKQARSWWNVGTAACLRCGWRAFVQEIFLSLSST